MNNNREKILEGRKRNNINAREGRRRRRRRKKDVWATRRNIGEEKKKRNISSVRGGIWLGVGKSVIVARHLNGESFS